MTVAPALVITPRDNVATALETLDAGRVVEVNGQQITIIDPTPRGHKIALRPIRAGESVMKYGSTIGTAIVDIAPGAHVHTHNVASGRGRGDLHPEAGAPRIAEPPDVSPVTGRTTQ